MEEDDKFTTSSPKNEMFEKDVALKKLSDSNAHWVFQEKVLKILRHKLGAPENPHQYHLG